MSTWREQLRFVNEAERARVVEKCGSVLRISIMGLVRVMEEKAKRKQKSRAHVSVKGIVVTGVKQSHQAHQSDWKNCRIQEKIGGRLCARERRVVEHKLAALVNPSGGGTTPGITSTPNVFHG